MSGWRYERTNDDGVHCVHAHVWGPSVSIHTSGNLDSTESDMRLIAAAPDLLRVAMAALGAYEALALIGANRHLPGFYSCINDTRAAIAKATQP